jgi:hypothetical protein
MNTYSSILRNLGQIIYNVRLTHDEPVLNAAPFVRPLIQSQCRVRDLLPHALLHWCIAPHINDRRDPTPLVHRPHDCACTEDSGLCKYEMRSRTFKQVLINPVLVFAPIRHERGCEMSMGVDDRRRARAWMTR